MPRRARRALIAPFAVALTITATAQDRTTATPGTPRPASIAGSAFGACELDGAVLAVGPGFRARFEPGSVEFTPALGEAARRDLPLRFTLESIRRGERLLLDARSAPAPAARRHGDLVVFERGVVRERYEVRVDGIEQSFVFAAPLPGSGDLVVRGRIETELPAGVADANGVPFVQPGVGGVRFGNVTGVGADGARVAGSIRHDAGALELVLPAHFVDDATFPLVLDPLIAAEFMGTAGGNDDVGPDVAYDETNDVYLVVWRRRISAVSSDIYGQFVDPGGSLSGSAFVISSGGYDVRPRVANVNDVDRFLVVAQVAPTPAGPWDIICRAVDAAGGGLSALASIANTVDDEVDPGVSGNAIPGAQDAAVVWEVVGAGVRAREVQVPAAGAPLPAAVQTVALQRYATQPYISKSAGATGNRILGYRNHPTGSVAHVVVRGYGPPLAWLWTVTTVGSTDAANPAVDGDGEDFMLVWDQLEVGSGRDIYCQMVDFSAMGLVGSSTTILSSTGTIERSPDVVMLDYEPQLFAVACIEAMGGLDNDVIGGIFDPDCAMCDAQFRLTGLDPTAAYTDENAVRMIGKRTGSSSPASDAGMLVFHERENTAPFDGDIVGQEFEALGPGGAVTSLGGGCGLGGSNGFDGPVASGNTELHATLTGASALSPFMAIGIEFTSSTVSSGPCTFLSTGYTIVFPTMAGEASFPLGIPCNPAFVGLVFYTQWAALLSGVSPAPLLPPSAQVSFSDRLQVVIGY